MISSTKIFHCSFLLCVLQFSRQVLGDAFLQWRPSHPAFDPSIYQDALDPELCEMQLEYLRNNTLLRLQFLDAGARIPRGIFIGNKVDLGNYYQCLGITHLYQGSEIQGKYCLVKGTLNEDLIYNVISLMFARLNNDEARSSDFALKGSQLRLAVCVPKTCTSKQGFQGLLSGLDFNLEHFDEEYCRLPNDKPWAPVDYVTIGLVSIIGLLTTLSTFYDLYYTKILDKDATQLNTVFRSFSIYTNTRNLLTFNSNPGSLDCLNGIRTLAIAWVIIGHSIITQPFWVNPKDTYKLKTDWTSLWLTAAPLTVDTFFMLSGLLVVYNTARKMTGTKLLKNIHLFYLNRLLRLFPILAAGILLEASIAHRVSDGPYWQAIADRAERCRTMWWATLLHVQNYVCPRSLCIGQTWYLAVDVQLHTISPIVLVWVVGRKRKVAIIALAVAILVSLTSATIYNFVNKIPSAPSSKGRHNDLGRYMTYFYFNTLTRAPPFFVGMIFGYVLHMWRENKIIVPKLYVTILWFFTFMLFSAAMYATYPAMQSYWNDQIADSMINSFQRTAWALGLGWLILACVHGYGGPINWLLSLQMWKFPARISYGMFILHWSLMAIVYGSRLAPAYFSVKYIILNFLCIYSLTFIVALIVTVVIDSPFSILFKIILRQGKPDSCNQEVRHEDKTKYNARS